MRQLRFVFSERVSTRSLNQDLYDTVDIDVQEIVTRLMIMLVVNSKINKISDHRHYRRVLLVKTDV